MQMFSATAEIREDHQLLANHGNPAPVETDLAAVGTFQPATMRIKVDFPAPFSPVKRVDLPRRTSRRTRTSSSIPAGTDLCAGRPLSFLGHL